MRRLLFVVAIAGCAPHAGSSGPAWPKPSHSDDDGGESIAPRASRPVAVAIEKTEEEPVATPAPTPTPTPAAATPAKKDAGGAPAVTAPAGAVEETITTEDIVIEIDD